MRTLWPIAAPSESARAGSPVPPSSNATSSSSATIIDAGGADPVAASAAPDGPLPQGRSAGMVIAAFTLIAGAFAVAAVGNFLGVPWRR